MIAYMAGKSKHERAAAMRARGASIETIMRHFGWSKSTAQSMVSRGKRADAFRIHHRDYQRRSYGKIGREDALS